MHHPLLLPEVRAPEPGSSWRLLYRDSLPLWSYILFGEQQGRNLYPGILLTKTMDTSFFAKDHCHQEQKPEVVLEALYPKLPPPLMHSDSLALPNYPAHLTVTSRVTGRAFAFSLTSAWAIHNTAPTRPDRSSSTRSPAVSSRHHPTQKRRPLAER